MNIENFKEFLENPSRLYQLSYQELKSLVLQYPYSTNLHYLLLQKSAMENHRELEQNHQKAATYSIDRTFLFHLLRELAVADKKEPILQLDEDFLELKDLSFLEMDRPAPEANEERRQTSSGPPPTTDFPELSIDLSDELAEESEEPVNLTFTDVASPSPDPALETLSEDQLPKPVTELLNDKHPVQDSGVPTEPAVEALSPSGFQVPDPVLLTAASIVGITRGLDFPSRAMEETVEPAIDTQVSFSGFQAPYSLILGAASAAGIAGQLNLHHPSVKENPTPSGYQAPYGLVRKAVSVASITGILHRSRPDMSDTTTKQVVAIPASPKEAKQELIPVSSLEMKKQLLDKLNSLIEDRAAVTAVKKPTPQPKVSFTSWVQQFQPDHVKQQLSDLMEAKKREELKRLKKKRKKTRKKKKKASKDQRIVQFAEQSLTSHQTIVSETLAELLAEQGETQMSIAMYERLKLFFPEKSTYFAAIIEKLKTK